MGEIFFSRFLKQKGGLANIFMATFCCALSVRLLQQRKEHDDRVETMEIAFAAERDGLTLQTAEFAGRKGCVGGGNSTAGGVARSVRTHGKAETKGVKQVLAQYTMEGPMGSKARNRHSARGRRRPLAILGCSDEEDEDKGKHRRGAARGTTPPITSGGDAGGGSPRRGKDKRGPGDDGGSGGGGGDDDGDATSSGNGHPARWVVPKEGHEK